MPVYHRVPLITQHGPPNPGTIICYGGAQVTVDTSGDEEVLGGYPFTLEVWEEHKNCSSHGDDGRCNCVKLIFQCVDEYHIQKIGWHFNAMKLVFSDLLRDADIHCATLSVLVPWDNTSSPR